MRPQGNGLVGIYGETPEKENRFFCMDLVGFLSKEIEETGDNSWEHWHSRFKQAEAGNCAFQEICPRYARTMARVDKQPRQLSLFLVMITINGVKFYEPPTFCGGCPAICIGRNDTKGFCSFFDKSKNKYDSPPKRCQELFKKGFEIGGDLVIVLKEK